MLKVSTNFIQIAEINGQSLELITPKQFLEGIHKLGIDDLREDEVTTLLKFLMEPEFEGYIILDEIFKMI